MFPRLLKPISSKILGIRSASTAFLRVANIEVPQNISQEFFHTIDSHYNRFSSPEFHLKPMTLKEGEIGTNLLKELVKKDAVTNEAFKQARENHDITATLINGISVSEFSKIELPTELSDLQDQDLIKKLRINEVTAYAYSKLIGINPQEYMGNGLIVTPIFATDSEKNNPSSYRSGKELLWHSDGWSREEGSIPHVMLLGIVGKKEIRTELVDARDIINFFKESNKAHYLNILSTINYLEGSEYCHLPVKILSPDGKINFAQYGNFIPRLSSDQRDLEHAVDFLNEALTSGAIPSFGLSILSGQGLGIHNDQALHRKTTLPSSSPQNMNTNSIGERLLLRVHGTAEKGNSRTN